MKIIGIIAEYNPFHNGHYHQLHKIKQEHPHATIVVVMSGSFVQRGTPAFFSKFDRTRWALYGGADLIVELPTIYSLSSAEIFASGAIRLLDQLGTTHLSFGSESEDINLLQQISIASFSENVQKQCRLFLQNGHSYGSALRLAIIKELPAAKDIINEPNALLGIEYLRAIQAHQLNMEALPILRTSSHHNTKLTDDFPSGTALRKLLSTITLPLNRTSPQLPTTDVEQLLSPYFPTQIVPLLRNTLNKGSYLDIERYYTIIHGANRTLTSAKLSTLADFTEGVEHRWMIALNSPTWNLARDAIKSKRYTYARIDRMAAYTLFNITKNILSKAHQEGPSYTRLLGFSQRGRELLKYWSKQENPISCELIQKWAPAYQAAEGFKQQLMNIDMQATNIQHLCFKTESTRLGGQDYLYSPYYYEGYSYND